MIGIIDYGAGNLHSVEKAIRSLGVDVRMISDSADFRGISKMILPGVGNAGRTMEILDQTGLSKLIKHYVHEGIPFLGICLGMQLLLEYSEENDAACLGLIEGKVQAFQKPLKIPHMGWNEVKIASEHYIFEGIPDHSDFYFVHSFYASPAQGAHSIGITDYGSWFTSVVAKGNRVGVQFHPEKSGEKGLKLLENFCFRE